MMRLRIGASVCAIVLLGASNLMAQGKLVCSLLTATEVAAALGSSKAGVEREMPIPGAPKEATLKLCSWPLASGGGGLQLSASRMDPRISFESLVSQSFQAYEALKAQGWTEDRKDFGGVKCLAVKPPAGKEEAAPLTTSCMAQGKEMFLAATTMTKTPVSMDKVKILIDSAMGRL